MPFCEKVHYLPAFGEEGSANLLDEAKSNDFGEQVNWKNRVENIKCFDHDNSIPGKDLRERKSAGSALDSPLSCSRILLSGD